MATLIRELEAVEQAHDRLGLTYRELAQAVNADETTLHRWRRGEGSEPSPVFLARLEALGDFLTELGQAFRRWNDARTWLDERVPLLKDRTPRELILAGHVDRVTGLLYALNAGLPL